jgi:hypothetical protein
VPGRKKKFDETIKTYDLTKEGAIKICYAGESSEGVPNSQGVFFEPINLRPVEGATDLFTFQVAKLWATSNSFKWLNNMVKLNSDVLQRAENRFNPRLAIFLDIFP